MKCKMCEEKNNLLFKLKAVSEKLSEKLDESVSLNVIQVEIVVQLRKKVIELKEHIDDTKRTIR